MAVTQSPPKPLDGLDLEYAVDDDIPPGPWRRDSEFVFARMPKLITDKATEGSPGRVLDVGCGFGGQLALLCERGWEGWGLDASFALARYSSRRFDRPAPAVCAAAEALPFRDGSFDALVCQGSLDHFARPQAFLREAARVLRPDGRAVIALANYDSLSSRLGSRLYWLKRRLGLDVYEGRNYWQIPANHTFHGSYRVLLGLARPHLELVECRGISLLWLFHRWTWLMERLPRRLAWPLMSALDRVAYVRPQIADVIVSVWRPRSTDGN